MPPMVGAFSANRSICCGTQRRADLCLLWRGMGLSPILVARRGDTLESAASDAVERMFRTSRKSAPSITLRAPTSRCGARPPDAPWRRPTDQTSTLESPANCSRRMQSGRSERQHRSASQLPHGCRSPSRTMDATDIAAPKTRYRGQPRLSHAERVRGSSNKTSAPQRNGLGRCGRRGLRAPARC